ncbi:MAG: phenylalanine 4-monooxygenase [Bdellovibrionota bacterium]
MKEVSLHQYSKQEHETWKLLFARLTPKRSTQIHQIFLEGLDALKITEKKIPDIAAVNLILRQKTGFVGVPVEGLEEAGRFFSMLAKRKFPIGNFIRDRNDLSYTPAPDVFHDLYGHLPFLADERYADFCHEFGLEASQYASCPLILRQFERLFWFGVEFPLIRTKDGLRIFGGGIASSLTECDYALSEKPKLIPFDLEKIRFHDYKIDELQAEIFCLDSPEQLYASVMELVNRIPSAINQ